MSTSTTLTIPVGAVSANLAAFVVRVDLAHLGPTFWAGVSAEGANVRVRQAGSLVPVDVVWIDPATSTGELFFKAPLLSAIASNVFEVETLDGAPALAATDPNGRNAVWSAYDAVFVGAPGRTAHVNRSDGTALVAVTGDVVGVADAGRRGYFDFSAMNRTLYVSGRPQRSVYTLGVSTYSTDATTSNKGALFYTVEASTSNANRVNICDDGGNTRGVWNSTNAWRYYGAIVRDVAERRTVTFDGTTQMLVYLDGALAHTDDGIAARPPSGPADFGIGAAHRGTSERWQGYLNYAYLRPGLVSAAWADAEHDSWHTPSAFYSVAAIPPVVVAGGRATESASARAGTTTVAPGPVVVAGGRASEGDAARAGVSAVGALVAGGRSLEQQAARAGAALVGVLLAGGQAAETDAARAGRLSLADIVPGGRSAETDTARAGSTTVGVTVVGGVAVEVDQARPGLARVSLVVVGARAVETDTAAPGAVTEGPGAVTVLGGVALELDVASSGVVLGGTVTILGGVAVEIDEPLGGVTLWDPPVETAPIDEPDAPGGGGGLIPGAGVRVSARRVSVARAYTGAVLDQGRPRMVGVQTVEAPRLRTRVVVGGRDVSFFRGVATPTPTYSLISPLLYGSGSISFPQVHAAFERLGVGDLEWARPGARVAVQLVLDPAPGEPGPATVVETPWRGFLLDPQLRGRDLTFGLAGEASGRLSLIDRPPRLFRRRNDLGFWWNGLLAEVGLPTTDEVETGIKLLNSGGNDGLTYANELSANGVRQGGGQWTCMPETSGPNAGRYRVRRKNLTAIRGTVYFDDAGTVADLRRDPAEEPNRIWATGVSPSGRRIRFADYPALAKGRPVPFPGFLEPGDAGDGVIALVSRLVWTGYLSHDERPGAYDSDVAAAVRELQRDAGLEVTGRVNAATWDALYDTTVTGYSTSGAQIRPAVQRRATKRYLRTATGNVKGLNPDYDPDVLLVDRSLDVGAGFTENQVQAFAREELHDSATPNWSGTIAFNLGGLVNGEHTPGQPITWSDMLDARRLKPGDNLWAPLFDGGTLLHVTGCEVSRGDGGLEVVTASVDTRGRDTMAAWEIIERNRESRRNPARSWLRNHRASGLVSDAVTEWDDIGGVVERTELTADQWTVVPVVAGQEGTIARLHVRLEDDTEFAVAVFGREITGDRLDARIGDPLSKAGRARWQDEEVLDELDEDFLLLYAAGDPEQPCGYFPKAKGDDGARLTGRWKDDAGFSYYAYDDCSLWLAIYPKESTALREGRVMRNQAQAVT